MKRLVLLTLFVTATAQAGNGPPAPAFYVDGVVYRTVGTPTDLPDAPAHTFDVIYDLGGTQPLNVSTVAPGDPGYNGGRWEAHAIAFDDYDEALAMYDANESGDFDSDEEVEAAIEGGLAIDMGVAARFVCPVIKMPRR